MRITKLGHCCLVVEITPLPAAPTTPPRGLGTPPRAGGDGGTPLVRGDKPVRIMTDPGAWSTRQNEEKGIDYIFITHEHQDHFNIESLKKVLANNPKAKVITNKGVGSSLMWSTFPTNFWNTEKQGSLVEFMWKGTGRSTP